MHPISFTPLSPASPSASSGRDREAPARKRRRVGQATEESSDSAATPVVPEVEKEKASSWHGAFLEVGCSGHLARAVAAKGVPTLRPWRGQSGRADLAERANVDALLSTLAAVQRAPTEVPDALDWLPNPPAHGVAGSDRRLCCYVHALRPSFTRAQRRQKRTTHRTPASPWGIVTSTRVEADNAYARGVSELAAALQTQGGVCLVGWAARLVPLAPPSGPSARSRVRRHRPHDVHVWVHIASTLANPRLRGPVFVPSTASLPSEPASTGRVALRASSS